MLADQPCCFAAAACSARGLSPGQSWLGLLKSMARDNPAADEFPQVAVVTRLVSAPTSRLALFAIRSLAADRLRAGLDPRPAPRGPGRRAHHVRLRADLRRQGVGEVSETERACPTCPPPSTASRGTRVHRPRRRTRRPASSCLYAPAQTLHTIGAVRHGGVVALDPDRIAQFAAAVHTSRPHRWLRIDREGPGRAAGRDRAPTARQDSGGGPPPQVPRDPTQPYFSSQLDFATRFLGAHRARQSDLGRQRSVCLPESANRVWTG